MNRGPGSAQRRGDGQQLSLLASSLGLATLPWNRQESTRGLLEARATPLAPRRRWNPQYAYMLTRIMYGGSALGFLKRPRHTMPAARRLRCRAHATSQDEAEGVEAQGTCSRRLSPTQGKRSRGHPALSTKGTREGLPLARGEMAPRVVSPHGRLCVTGTFGADGNGASDDGWRRPRPGTGYNPLACLSRLLAPAR